MQNRRDTLWFSYARLRERKSEREHENVFQLHLNSLKYPRTKMRERVQWKDWEWEHMTFWRIMWLRSWPRFFCDFSLITWFGTWVHVSRLSSPIIVIILGFLFLSSFHSFLEEFVTVILLTQISVLEVHNTSIQMRRHGCFCIKKATRGVEYSSELYSYCGIYLIH